MKIQNYQKKSDFNFNFNLKKTLGSYPNLKDLICEESDEQFTDSRWSLFQWLTELDADFISRVRASSEPKHIRVALFAVKLLVKLNLKFSFLQITCSINSYYSFQTERTHYR